MTDVIHKQEQLNKLNARHALLECRLSHLREILKEKAFLKNIEMKHALDFAVDCTLCETFAALRQIRELEDELAEQNARRV